MAFEGVGGLNCEELVFGGVVGGDEEGLDGGGGGDLSIEFILFNCQLLVEFLFVQKFFQQVGLDLVLAGLVGLELIEGV